MLDMRIGPETARFAVLGESLPHTWSPYIHNSIFSAAGRNAVYFPVTVPRERLAAALDVFRSCFSGFNVTIPYKEAVMPFLDEIDDAARLCGAVNTVENRGGRLIGHITDGLGMLAAIEECGIRTINLHTLILGGGGAARVAAYEFLQRGGSITLAVRSLEKGLRLARELSDTQSDGMTRIRVCELSRIPEDHFDLLVNCTPVGMYPHESVMPVTENVVSRCAAVFDAVYNPRTTALLACAGQHRIPCVEGLGMLFYQAVEAHKFWFDSVGAEKEALSGIYQDLRNRL